MKLGHNKSIYYVTLDETKDNKTKKMKSTNQDSGKQNDTDNKNSFEEARLLLQRHWKPNKNWN